MLIYHPAFDTYHSIYRILKLLDKLPKKSYHIDHIRIFDFYLLFPAEISNIQLPNTASSFRKYFKSNKYNKVPDVKRVFLQLERYQVLALECMASYGIIDAKLLSENVVSRTNINLPENLKISLKEDFEYEKRIWELFTEHLAQIPLSGQGGLKMRTNLLEFRYDVTEG